MLCAQLEEDFVRANPEWVKELEIMVSTKVGAVVSCCGEGPGRAGRCPGATLDSSRSQQIRRVASCCADVPCRARTVQECD